MFESYDINPKRERFSNHVAETPEKYTALTPYYKRSDLTATEIVEIGNYQDIHPWNLQKQDWSFPIPKNWKNKTHCYVNNSCCRSNRF